MPSLGAEAPAVQLPMLRYVQQIGWKLVAQVDALKRRGGETGLVFAPQLTSKLIELNRANGLNGVHAAEIIRRLQSLPSRIEGNREMLSLLRGEWSVYHAGKKRQINVCVIDFDHLDANVFEVTMEWEYTNGQDKNRYDVVFLINGIPILVAETKAAHKPDGLTEGIKQIRRYHDETPEMMAALQLFDVTQLRDLFYGVTWSLERKNLFNWRDEQPGNYEAKIKAFCDRERILKYLEDYIVFAVKDDELHKFVLRQHQTRAVEKVVERAKDPAKRRGLIWHTQGSGKTLTMITAAQQILEHPAFDKPTILMLVDRNELETQLFNNIRAVGITPEITESKKHVQELLASDHRGLIVSMIHKFEGMPKDLNTRDTIFVLIDEAHRSTGGHLGNYLLAALPNATWIGFTGTPIDLTAYGKGTFKVFGIDDPQGYLDKYSIAESVADGTTLKLHYQLAPNKLRVDRDLLEAEFMNLAEAQGVADIDELNAILDRAVNLKAFMKDAGRIDAIARFVATHFKETVEPLGYKAFLVGVDRQACAMYKKALDKYLPAAYSRVIFTSAHNDGAELKAHKLDDTEEKKLRKAFVRPEQLPKILIVTEKLLTGYDAPVLYCMYLDKPMRDHVLLQAIARVNRPYEEDGRKKPAGFVLDFVGIFENLQKALSFDSDEIEAVIQNIDVLKALFKTLMGEQAEPYLKLSRGGDDKAVEAAIDAFTDKQKRTEFYRFFKKLEALYEIISPDVFLRDFIDDYLSLARLYEQIRAWFTPQAYVDQDLMNKTRFLVSRHVSAAQPSITLKLYEIDEKTLDALHRGKEPDSVKVINLAKSLAVKIADEIKGKPHLNSIGDMAEQVVERYDERQIDTRTALDTLEVLVREYNEARQEEAAKKFQGKNTFAIYWLLHKLGVDNDALAVKVDEIMTRHPHWKLNPENARQLRLTLTVVLMSSVGKDRVVEVIDKLLALERLES